MNNSDLIWGYLIALVISLIILYYGLRFIFSVSKLIDNQEKIIQLLKELRDK